MAARLLTVVSVVSGVSIDKRFSQLATRYGVHSRVQLSTPHGGERGLFTTAAVKAGEPVLAVPFELCLVCMAEPEADAIQSPWDAPLRDARDTLLARQLLSLLFAVDDVDVDDDVELREDFWREWSEMLPEVGTLSHPLTLPASSLADLHDDALAHAAELQQARVEAVLGGMPEAAVGESAAAEGIALRRWAVALCSSRPFSLPYGGDGGEQLAAFVPFVDMANHDAEPNCEVQGRGEGRPQAVEAALPAGEPSEAAEAAEWSELQAVGLIARRDLKAGEEVLISYFGAAPNSHVFSRFGFVTREPNRHDRVLGMPEALAPLSAAAVRQTTAACKGRWDAAGAYFEAALLSMPLTREPSAGPAAEVEAAKQIETWLRETAEREFASGLEEDEAEQRQPEARAYGSDEAVRGALLAYRVQRKRLWATAVDVLAAHQEVHASEMSATAAS